LVRTIRVFPVALSGSMLAEDPGAAAPPRTRYKNVGIITAVPQNDNIIAVLHFYAISVAACVTDLRYQKRTCINTMDSQLHGGDRSADRREEKDRREHDLEPDNAGPDHDRRTAERRQTFGRWLYDMRTDLRLTQKEAAKRAQIGHNTWCRLENGQSTPMRATVLQIAEGLELERAEALSRAGLPFRRQPRDGEDQKLRDTGLADRPELAAELGEIARMLRAALTSLDNLAARLSPHLAADAKPLRVRRSSSRSRGRGIAARR
jgi:transcriptional regulator with XRE-family HTH domain